jgi:opacity protein-like surface antigen
VRRWLEPASLYVGAGVGFTAVMDIDGTSNVVSVHDDPIDFAWNVGTGLSYAVSDRMTFSPRAIGTSAI